jgi:hypothetical protein
VGDDSISQAPDGGATSLDDSDFSVALLLFFGRRLCSDNDPTIITAQVVAIFQGKQAL